MKKKKPSGKGAWHPLDTKTPVSTTFEPSKQTKVAKSTSNAGRHMESKKTPARWRSTYLAVRSFCGKVYQKSLSICKLIAVTVLKYHDQLIQIALLVVVLYLEYKVHHVSLTFR